MAVSTPHIVPFIVKVHSKRMHTIFLSEIIRLVLGPSCEIRPSKTLPSEVSLCCNIVQAKPRFFAVVAMLQINVFLVIVNISKD